MRNTRLVATASDMPIIWDSMANITVSRTPSPAGAPGVTNPASHETIKIKLISITGKVCEPVTAVAMM